MFIHINKLHYSHKSEKEWVRYSNSWVYQGVRDGFQGQLILVLQYHFTSPPPKRRMSDENFHTSSGYNSAFLKTLLFYVSYTMCFFTLQWNLSLKCDFLFFWVEWRLPPLDLSTETLNIYLQDMLWGFLSYPTSHGCIFKFNVLFPIGCHCRHMDTRPNLPSLFAKPLRVVCVDFSSEKRKAEDTGWGLVLEKG